MSVHFYCTAIKAHSHITQPQCMNSSIAARQRTASAVPMHVVQPMYMCCNFSALSVHCTQSAFARNTAAVHEHFNRRKTAHYKRSAQALITTKVYVLQLQCTFSALTSKCVSTALKIQVP